MRDAGFAPHVGRARTTWTRQGLELRDAGIWPGVGKARTAWIRSGLELRDAGLLTVNAESRVFRLSNPNVLKTPDGTSAGAPII